MRVQCFPWSDEQESPPKVVYRSLYQKDNQQNVLEVYHQGQEVWYQEYNFQRNPNEDKAISCQTKARICLDDINQTLEKFSEKNLREGYSFCYTYSCNIKSSDTFGLDYCFTPISTQAAVKKDKPKTLFASVPVIKSRKKERKKKIDTDIELVRNYFHLPMNVATQELQIGSTALKKICRKYGISRWPYRRIKAIEKLIQQLEETGADADKDNDTCLEGKAIRERLQDLHKEKEILCLQGQG